jgi:hypothetical protein
MSNFMPSRCLAVLSLLVALAASGCGRPDLKIDNAELENSALKSTARVGLLEAHRANTGTGYGMSIGETIGESAFCTGTVLEDGNVLTSSDCMQGKFGNFDIKDMEFHIRYSGSAVTQTYKVLSLIAADSKRNTAILKIREDSSEVALESSNSLSEVPTDEELGANLSALAVSVTAPDKNGIAKIKVSSTTILTAEAAIQAPTIPSTPPPNAPPAPPIAPVVAEDSLPPSDGNGALPKDPAGAATKPQFAGFTAPMPLAVKGLQDGIWGAPIYYKGKIVGVVRKPSSETDSHNAQWILKK